MFNIGERVRYGSSGVCEVTAIGPLKMSGIDPKRNYYTLKNIFTDSIIYTPVDTTIPMRHLVTREEAAALIDRIPELECPQIQVRNSNELDAAYRETFHFDQCDDLATLLKLLYEKRAAAGRGRRFCSADERVFHQAQAMLYQELAAVLDLPLPRVEGYIEERLAALQPG